MPKKTEDWTWTPSPDLVHTLEAESTDAAWRFTYLYLHRNAPAIQQDLGPVELARVDFCLAKVIRQQWDAVATLLREEQGPHSARILARSLGDFVRQLEADEAEKRDDEAGPAPMVERRPPPPPDSGKMEVPLEADRAYA